MRCTVPVPMPRDLATLNIPRPFASRFRTFRSVALSIFGLAEPHAMSDGALSCVKLSCNGLSSDSLPPPFGQRAGVPYGCGMGRPYGGKTMAKLLNELGRTFTPCPLALADRDRREALRDQQSLTAAFFGDPLPGMSALDRRERERPH